MLKQLRNLTIWGLSPWLALRTLDGGPQLLWEASFSSWGLPGHAFVIAYGPA